MSWRQWGERLRVGGARAGVVVPAALLLVLVGGLLVVDREGLRGEYRALGAPWEGEPYAVRVSLPELAPAAPSPEAELAPGDVLVSRVLFSVRWSGGWHVARGGEYRFSIEADDGAWLRLDGEPVLDSEGRFGEPVAARTVELAPGFHAIEIGFRQGDGASRLALRVAPPGRGAEPLAAADLYPAGPRHLRAALRRALASWSRPWRQLLGAGLLLAAAAWLAAAARRSRWSGRPAAALARWRQRVAASRRLRAALLLALVAAAFLAALPRTGTVRGGDDAVYLAASNWGESSWFFHRYVHVHLLRLFVELSGGDPLLGTRLWWSFAFAVTVGALAVAVRSTGPGLQLRTLAVVLFLLAAQSTLFGMIGAAFADVSAMMFLTVAVAVWLHGRARPRPADGRPWHAFAVGALTVAAWHSKEVGAVGFVLLGLDAIEDGRLELRRWARRAAWFGAGALAVLGLRMLLDGWLLGDFFFLFDSTRRAGASQMNFPEQMAPRGAAETWLAVVWRSAGGAAGLAMRNLWIAVAAAAVAAGLRRRRLELQLLHLLPLAYLLALTVLYIRLPHPFSGRMLLTILPVACLMAGLLARDAGLEEVAWRQLAAPRVAIPAALAAAFLVFVVVPYRAGLTSAAELVSASRVGRFGWQPGQFLDGVAAPALVLVAVAALALVAASREARIAALLLAALAFFGPGVAANQAALSARWAAQSGDLLLYPWRQFGDSIRAARPRRIALSPDLFTQYHMAHRARTAVARLAVGRRDFRVRLDGNLPRQVDLAIASPAAYERWRQELPALAATAERDRAGFLVLVRPKQAAAAAAGRAGERRGAAGRPVATRP